MRKLKVLLQTLVLIGAATLTLTLVYFLTIYLGILIAIVLVFGAVYSYHKEKAEVEAGTRPDPRKYIKRPFE